MLEKNVAKFNAWAKENFPYFVLNYEEGEGLTIDGLFTVEEMKEITQELELAQAAEGDYEE